MWLVVAMFLFLLFLKDYFKPPRDLLYFQNPWRPIIGIRNSLIDLFYYRSEYNVRDHAGLSKIKENFLMIRDEFKKVSPSVEKKFMHDLDPMFDKTQNYYALECDQFPRTYELIKSIPCVDLEMTHFLVIEGPLYLVPHRAEFNHLLRYQMTIEGTKHSYIETEYGRFHHDEGQEFLFDHSRIHSLSKHDMSKRVVLCLNIKRFS